jgi:CPA1 family monovalent cation:H+ antiporter
MGSLALPIAAVGSGTEWVVLVGLAVLAALIISSSFTEVPYPIWLVLGGLALGFVPGLPDVSLDPDLVFLIALPPLLYAAAFFSSLRDLRANVRPISLLSIGLVITTTLTVALVAHAMIDDLSWGAAFVLGAVVSPTDAVAATSIARRLGVPRRVVTIVEGESLVNDATALVLYRVAVVAVLSGSFSLLDAGAKFVLSAVGGIAIGLFIGWLVAKVRQRIQDPPVEITLSLMTAYFAYLPAVALDVSGVLAAVTVGIYLGWNSPRLVTNPSTRIQAYGVWEILIFVLNVLLFVLLGLQLAGILDRLSGFSAATLVGYGALVSAVVILTRILWVFPLTYLPRYLFKHIRERDPSPSRQGPLLVAWTGMRGAVSLAAALAIPLETDAGAPFPARDLIVFLAFCVILATLVIQGLSMPALVRKLAVEDDGGEQYEENKARKHAAAAAIARIEEVADEDWVRSDTAQRMRDLYDYRRRRFAARFDDGDDGQLDQQSLAYQRLRREALQAEREAILDLRNRGVINDEVWRRVERDLDLEDTRLEI